MSTLMFWNKQNSSIKHNNESKPNKKNWLHSQETLVNGHVVYPVKFLGSIQVDQPKGIDTVKDAIRRLQFSQQIKKADSGFEEKLKKVELTISVDGVAIQEPKEHKMLYQFPLHTISYCTDEKGVKKFFSFIVKTNAKPSDQSNGVGNNESEDCHKCFIFISSKLASDITLTIGQAFELAYSRYLTDSGKVTKIAELSTKNQQLENTISVYRKRLKDLTDMLPKSEIDKLLMKYHVKDIYQVSSDNENGNDFTKNGISTIDNDNQLLISDPEPKNFLPIVPQRTFQNHINNTLEAIKPSIGTKMEELLLNSDSDSDFDPRADEHEIPTNFKNDSFGLPQPMSHPFFNNNGMNGILKPSPVCK